MSTRLTAVRHASSIVDSEVQMRSSIASVLCAVGLPAFGMQLQKAASLAPDPSLAGNLARPAPDAATPVPLWQYQGGFEASVSKQIAAKRQEQIRDLMKLRDLTDPKQPEAAEITFQLGELYWEESHDRFMEAQRLAPTESARREALLADSRRFADLAADQYVDIVQNHPGFLKIDAVLYFLGRNLLDAGQDLRAMVAFNRLIEKYPNSHFTADAYFARGEFYFDASKGRPGLLQKALAAYEGAAKSTQLHDYALYKEGWCYFNLGDYHRAMDMFRELAIAGKGD